MDEMVRFDFWFWKDCHVNWKLFKQIYEKWLVSQPLALLTGRYSNAEKARSEFPRWARLLSDRFSLHVSFGGLCGNNVYKKKFLFQSERAASIQTQSLFQIKTPDPPIAMTPGEMDLVLRRLVAMGAPKETCINSAPKETCFWNWR